MAEPLENFAHSTLDQAERQIRLLRFNKDFTFELEVHNVDTCPPYLALSYTWGSSERPHNICLNQRKFSIGSNLLFALCSIYCTVICRSRNPCGWKIEPLLRDQQASCRQFEPEGADRRVYTDDEHWYFWIDAICIDQESPKERNHQVRLIADIYRGAETVFVSLGPGCDDMFYYHSLGREPDLVSLWEAEYWKRLWTAQEFVLARDIVFVSVFYALPLDTINSLIVDKSYPEWRLPALEIRRKSVKEGKLVLGGTRRGATLRNVLWLFRKQKCSEIRDTIYAVLALVDWELEAAHSRRGPLEADYRMTVGELWDKIQEYGITWGELSPDFQSAVDMESGQRALIPEDARHFSKTKTRFTQDLRIEPAPWVEEEDRASIMLRNYLQGRSSSSKRDAPGLFRLSWKEMFCIYFLETNTAKLGSMYMNPGRWKEADGLEVQMSELLKRVFREEYPVTPADIANQALTYRKQGRWNEAEELGVRVFEMRKRMLGSEHPSTLTSMADLASTYRIQRRWREAEKLDVRVMETRKRVLGNEHLDTLSSISNLSITTKYQGRWSEAEELDMRVMQTRMRVLGEEHPDTLISMAILASTYRSQRRWKEAEELQAKQLKLCSKVLGEGHPSTLTSMNNFAVTQKGNGRDPEAIKLMRKCIRQRTQVLGSDHPSTLSSKAIMDSWELLNLGW